MDLLILAKNQLKNGGIVKMKKLTKSQIRKITKHVPKVNNMTSSRGNDIANQFIMFTPEAEIFQSYHTIIAVRTGGRVILDADKWDYSVTTGKYRNQFLGEGIADTRLKIESGEYTLADLN